MADNTHHTFDKQLKDRERETAWQHADAKIKDATAAIHDAQDRGIADESVDPIKGARRSIDKWLEYRLDHTSTDLFKVA